MFVLSQDRLAMDLDRDCLELMLSLLESDASHKDALDDCGLSHAELLKNKEKVRQLCADIQAQGHAKHLNLDNITVSNFSICIFIFIFILVNYIHNLYLCVFVSELFGNTPLLIGWSACYGNTLESYVKTCWRMVQRRITRIRWLGAYCKDNSRMSPSY